MVVPRDRRHVLFIGLFHLIIAALLVVLPRIENIRLSTLVLAVYVCCFTICVQYIIEMVRMPQHRSYFFYVSIKLADWKALWSFLKWQGVIVFVQCLVGHKVQTRSSYKRLHESFWKNCSPFAKVLLSSVPCATSALAMKEKKKGYMNNNSCVEKPWSWVTRVSRDHCIQPVYDSSVLLCIDLSAFKMLFHHLI